MGISILRYILLAGVVFALSAGAKTPDVVVNRLMSGTDFGESGEVDEHEESAVPLWMAGFTATNNIENNNTWLALRSQQMLTWDEPISNVVWLGAHNSFNSLGAVFPLRDGGVEPDTSSSPNQSVSVIGQLNLGVRLIGLELWADGDGTHLFLRNGEEVTGPEFEVQLEPVLQGISDWLDRPENVNEIVFLHFVDEVDDDLFHPGSVGARSALLGALTDFFGSQIYLPSDRLADGAWPSRRVLVEAGKRIIIFTHRRDANDSVFGNHTYSGTDWWFAGPAFLADSAAASGFGNLMQVNLGILRNTAIAPEQFSRFSAMQSDGLVKTPIPAAKTLDMIYAASRNLNFANVDFIFGHQNDAEGGYDTPDESDPLQETGPYDTHAHRGNRLKGLVWSWAENDPAVQRQWFQDFAGAGTGAALKSFFEFYFSLAASGINPKAVKDLETALEELLDEERRAWHWPALIVDMKDRGERARGNGRDYVRQQARGSKWRSATGTESLAYVLRSTTREPKGAYRWKVTTEKGQFNNWTKINLANYTDPDGMTYVFGAPINGFQNGHFDFRMLDPNVMNEPRVFSDLVEPFLDLYDRAAHSVFEARIKDAYDARFAMGANPLIAFLDSLPSADDPVWINVQDRNRDGIWVANDLTPAPPISAGGPYAVPEGGSVLLVGYVEVGTIEWDLDDDGVFGESGAAALYGDENVEQPTFDAAGLDGPDTKVVTMRNKPLTDPIKTYPVSLKVLNVAPEVTLHADLITGPGLGGEVELTVVLDDPGTQDKIKLNIDWDDGSPIQLVELGFDRETLQTHTYVAAVPISPTIAVTAEDGTDSTTRSVQISIAYCELGVSWNDGADGICHPCSDTCPAGTGFVSACSLVADVQCAACPPGTGNDGSSLECTELPNVLFMNGFEL